LQLQTSRDPRFDDLSGEYKPEIFEKTYNFINVIKQKEREVRERERERERERRREEEREREGEREL